MTSIRSSAASRNPLSRSRTTMLVVLAAIVTCLAFGASQASAYIYWGTSGKFIGRSLAGGKRMDKKFINTATAKTGTSIAALTSNGKYVFWVTGDGAIGRAKTNGKGVKRNIVGNSVFATDVAIAGSKIYWVTSASGVGTANLDGSSANPNLVPGTSGVNTAGGGIAVSSNYIYWNIDSDNTWGQSNPAGQGQATIARANLNGTGVNPNFVTGTFGVSGLDVDSSSLYAAVTLSGGGGSQVGSIGIGGGATTGFLPKTLANPKQVMGIALDGNTVYLTDQGYQSAAGSIPPKKIYGSVGSVETNGSHKRDLIRRLPSNITSVAVG